MCCIHAGACFYLSVVEFKFVFEFKPCLNQEKKSLEIERKRKPKTRKNPTQPETRPKPQPPQPSQRGPALPFPVPAQHPFSRPSSPARPPPGQLLSSPLTLGPAPPASLRDGPAARTAHARSRSLLRRVRAVPANWAPRVSRLSHARARLSRCAPGPACHPHPPLSPRCNSLAAIPAGITTGAPPRDPRRLL